MTLLEELDYEAFRRNRPVFVGFSDITAFMRPSDSEAKR